jgi:hypothetical protein
LAQDLYSTKKALWNTTCLQHKKLIVRGGDQPDNNQQKNFFMLLAFFVDMLGGKMLFEQKKVNR